jgi:hypothetical protein
MTSNIEVYQIDSSNYTFYAKIRKLHDDKYNIKFGSRIEDCATINFDIVEEYIYLNSFEHNYKCAFNKMQDEYDLEKS